MRTFSGNNIDYLFKTLAQGSLFLQGSLVLVPCSIEHIRRIRGSMVADLSFHFFKNRCIIISSMFTDEGCKHGMVLSTPGFVAKLDQKSSCAVFQGGNEACFKGN